MMYPLNPFLRFNPLVLYFWLGLRLYHATVESILSVELGSQEAEDIWIPTGSELKSLLSPRFRAQHIPFEKFNNLRLHLKGKPMVNSPFIRPYLLRRVALGGVYTLDSRDSSYLSLAMFCIDLAVCSGVRRSDNRCCKMGKSRGSR